jgi:O-antigen biosynthesis protein
MNNQASELEFTGERFVPGTAGDIELEHLHRYLLASQLCVGKDVLDIASGEGYGSALLARKAASVVGVDISEAAVKHASDSYPSGNLRFLQGDCAQIPMADNSVDVVVSFETIEHHTQHEEMMLEIKRVLRPNGVLVISSPDKYHYSEKPGFSNEYHVKELYEQEFKDLIGRYFKSSRYYGQRVVYASVILAEQGSSSSCTYSKQGDVLRVGGGVPEPLFWLAVASDADLPELPTGLFEQPISEVELVRFKQRDIDNAVEMLRAKDEHLQHASVMLAERDRFLAQAEQLLKEKDRLLAEATSSLRKRKNLLRRLFGRSA